MAGRNLVIGTRNAERHQKLSSAISTIQRITICTPDDFSVKESPQETGKTELENALLKAKFYYNQIMIPTLSVDDGLHLDNADVSPREKIKRNIGNNVDNNAVFHYWSKLLKAQGSQRGYIHKACAIVTDLHEIIWMNRIQVTLSFADVRYSDGNPLNYFIVPNGYTTPIRSFSADQSRKFTLYCYKPIIHLIKLYV
ncbi:hypothetical protein A3I56_02665 [Candidatus Roizmanbacteria bacterium RIFCSPLOWO2_02_FULL_43_10]|uniref:Non-canonical purine NTP pyrophosphatase n=1 Tax=Candidatus Roizmanbacteria bacterium RIFCSPLOWO2_02_FULL_43_10 TaxID=1802078 RepID=A0A1F7JUV6_9BACT|nr:MAG: hypothetical protein A3I56_02665 [Candidatus Roizmanbacteria bacterium RIFCSPLOWO2_02_FULL_43_10]